MKKLCAFAVISLTVSCSVEKIDTQTAGEVKMVRMEAVFADSKVSLTPDGDGLPLEWTWNDSDKIVAVGESGTVTQNCVLVETTVEGNAVFEVPEGTQWVVYPSAALTVSGTTGTYTIATKQNYNEGKVVGNGANPMIGKVTDGTIRFTNLCGYIDFPLTGSKQLSKLTLRTNVENSRHISGEATMDSSVDLPVLEFPATATGGKKQYSYVTVAAGGTALSSEPKHFYVVVPPATYKECCIVLEFADGTSASIVTGSEIKVNRNKVRRIATVDTDALFNRVNEAIDLSANGGRANCYLVEKGESPAAYKFPAMKIKGGTFENMKNASIVWSESRTLINNICYDGEYISFLYGGNNEDGNAVIGVDQNEPAAANTSLLWNFHIWVTDKPADVITGSGMPQPFMDRDLGATWAPETVAEIEGMTLEQLLSSSGTFYQYGNHIPYPRMERFESGAYANQWANVKVALKYAFSNYHHGFTTTTGAKNSVSEQESYSNYAYFKTAKTSDGNNITVNNNTEYIWTTIVQSGSNTGGDGVVWLWKTNNNNIQEKLTDYDPCPPGYVLPSATYPYQAGLNVSIVRKNMSGAGNQDFAGKYFLKDENLLWWPAAGQIWNGYRSVVGERVMHWTYYNANNDLTRLFRRAQMLYSNDSSFGYDNLPWSAVALNVRCRKFTKN
ncbi:MAG: hypothetical protein IJM35_09640 [Bacteroidales bacterium]|nr:hypothetical protein [Bacteroidales bacterium]